MTAESKEQTVEEARLVARHDTTENAGDCVEDWYSPAVQSHVLIPLDVAEAVRADARRDLEAALREIEGMGTGYGREALRRVARMALVGQGGVAEEEQE